jgi:hypothetical protein
MTVDERLADAGRMDDFLEAVERRDIAGLHEILTAVELDPATIAALLDRPFQPDWAVRLETVRRFRPEDWGVATRILRDLVLPFLEVPSRALDRARVHLALVKLSGGDVDNLRRAGKDATIDWRDVLVAAGLANADWRDVLAKQGFAVPAASAGGNEQ